MEQQKERALACLLGAAIGDAAGATLEFFRGELTEDVVRNAMRMPGGGSFNVGPGQVTDDSELMISLLYALAHNRDAKEFPIDEIAQQYIEWHKSCPFDMGRTCARAFGFCDNAAGMRKNARQYNMMSQANGAAMRVAPISIFGLHLEADGLVQCAKWDACLSHPNQACQDVNACLALAMAHLIKNKGDAEGALRTVEAYLGNNVSSEVKEWYDQSKTLNINHYKCDTNIGHVKHAFVMAMFFLRHETPFEDALYIILSKGGDTDTNAAIAMAVTGARVGLRNLPDYMVDRVINYDCTTRHKLHGQVRPSKYNMRNLVHLIDKLFA